MSAGELLPLSMVVAFLIISVLLILRRNGNGSSNGMGNGWRELAEERRRDLEMWRELAIWRGEQLRRSGIAPVELAEVETLSSVSEDIQRQFSMDEIDGLAFAIGIAPDAIPGDTASERARELVMAANRRQLLERLLAQVAKERPARPARTQ